MSLINLLQMNLQFFAADTGADGGGGNGDPDPDNTGREGTGTGKPDEKPEDENTFSQEDVNSIAAKESKKAQEKLFKELGIEDFDNAKEGFKKFKEWQEEQKTESEKQEEQLKKLAEDKNSLSKTVNQLESQISAMKAGVKADSVEDVIALSERLVTDEVSIDKAIKQVVEKYPNFSEIEEKSGIPSIVKPGNPNGSNNSNNNDPFASKLAKYK